MILGTNWSTFVKIMLVLNLFPSKGRSFSNLGLLAYVVKCINHNITGVLLSCREWHNISSSPYI